MKELYGEYVVIDDEFTGVKLVQQLKRDKLFGLLRFADGKFLPPTILFRTLEQAFEVAQEISDHNDKLADLQRKRNKMPNVFEREEIVIGKPQRHMRPHGGDIFIRLSAPTYVLKTENWNRLSSVGNTSALVMAHIERQGHRTLSPKKKDPCWSVYKNHRARGHTVFSPCLTYYEAIEAAKDFIMTAN